MKANTRFFFYRKAVYNKKLDPPRPKIKVLPQSKKLFVQLINVTQK